MSKEFDYTKVQHVTSVDQSDREVPYNLRQSGTHSVLNCMVLLYQTDQQK